MMSRHSTPYLAVVVSILLVVALLTTASFTLAGNGGDAAPEGVQLPVTPQVRYPGVYLTGIYATSGGVANLSTILDRIPETEGMLLTINWAYVEDQEPLLPDGSNGNWTNIDTAFAWAGAKSKAVGFLVSTFSSARGVVGSMPSYLWDETNPNYVDGAIVKTGLPGCEGVYDDPTCVFPRYWSDEYMNAYREFVLAMGRKYNGDPRLEFVAMGIGRDGENYPVEYGNNEVKQIFFDTIRNDLATKDLFCESYNPPCQTPLDVWIAVVKKYIDFYTEAFPNKVILVQLAGSVFTGNDRSREMREILDYAQQKTSQGMAVGQSVNGMYPNWLWAYMPGQTGRFDHFPLHGPDYAHNRQKGNPDHTYPTAMEGYYEWMGCENEQGHPYGNIQIYWTLLASLSKHVDYIRLYNDVFVEWNNEQDRSGGPNWDKRRENIIALIGKWTKFLGRTPETAPGAWVALRDHKGPWYQCQGLGPPNQRTNPGYPDYGDYSYWLYHDFTKTGGRTVPETAFPGTVYWGGFKAAIDFMGDPYSPYFNDEPYNPDLPRRKETWAIRRTDEATGNPYMFFDIDDAYIGPANPASAVTITVTYVDMGTDTFSLYYQAAGGSWQGKKAPLYALYEVQLDDTLRPISITQGITDIPKEGTKQIRKAVFVVNDADFRNGIRQGSDLYISSNNDGDEWVHMVYVTKGEPTPEPTPTPWPSPTPTATPTPLPTATPTPTPTPSTAAIQGRVFFDRDRDGVMDPDEPGVAGATVRLLRGGQLVGQPVTTDETGAFSFTGLVPGYYILMEDDPPAYMSTTTNQYAGWLTAGSVVTDWNFGDYTNQLFVPAVER